MWIHAASGEFEYAKPVIRLLKERHPETPVLVTYFSPSFQKQVESFEGVTLACALPLDLKGPLQHFIKNYRPRILLIARTDLWPEMLAQAKYAGIPTVLFSATFGRLSFLQRLIKSFALKNVDRVFCVSDIDTENLRALPTPPPGETLGDTRYDQVLERLRKPKEHKPFAHFKVPTLVAGSTWPEDENELLQACANFIQEGRLRLILVPHETTKEHIRFLCSELERLKLPFERYSDVAIPSAPVVIVDVVGILAEIYQLGDLAFVGGSFRRSVHSVMEPLATGLLTAVGPYHHNNREASEFMKIEAAHGLTAVTELRSSEALSHWVERALALHEFPKSKIIRAVTLRTQATSKLLDRINALYKSQMTQE